MIKYLLAFLSAIFLSIALGKITIPLLKRLKAGQTILVYVSEHESKNGTPTMGGLFFIFAIILAFVFFGGLKSNIARVCLVITCAFMFVGFMDDFIKIRSKNNEGLKPYQKIIFQVLIGVIAGIYAYKTGIDYIYIPFFKTTFNLGLFTIPLLAVVFIAITNSVNLTDGLDGLSGSVTVAYLLGFIAVIFAQSFYYGESYFFIQEFDGLMLLSITSIGAILGFLTFNVFRAKVFMGDTGSLALGGLIGSLSKHLIDTIYRYSFRYIKFVGNYSGILL